MRTVNCQVSSWMEVSQALATLASLPLAEIVQNPSHVIRNGGACAVECGFFGLNIGPARVRFVIQDGSLCGIGSTSDVLLHLMIST